MIKEQYVSFEVAVLLKKKGFDMSSVYKGYNIFDGNHTQDSIEDFSRSEAPHLYVPTITQSLAMRWLREVHGLFIEIHTFYECEELPFACRYQIISNNKDYESMEDESDECFYTYEEAVEAAITECLECYL